MLMYKWRSIKTKNGSSSSRYWNKASNLRLEEHHSQRLAATSGLLATSRAAGVRLGRPAKGVPMKTTRPALATIVSFSTAEFCVLAEFSPNCHGRRYLGWAVHPLSIVCLATTCSGIPHLKYGCFHQSTKAVVMPWR